MRLILVVTSFLLATGNTVTANPFEDFFGAFSSKVVKQPAHYRMRHHARYRMEPRLVNPRDRSWTAHYADVSPHGFGGSLLSTALQDQGRGNFTGVGRWCAAAMNKWLLRSGHRPLGSNRARDFARYGRPTHLHPGAILVWAHHTGVYAGGGLTLSGNGKGHRVHLGKHSLRGLIAMRDPV